MAPDTCAFISQSLNKLMTDRGNARREHLIGVYLHKPTGKFLAQCRVNSKLKHLGLFDYELGGHLVYAAFKAEQIAIAMQDPELPRGIYHGLHIQRCLLLGKLAPIP